MKRLSWWSLALAIVVLAWPSAARACSCLPIPPPAEAREKAAVVFEGRPIAQAREDHMRRFTFAVSRVFEGDAEDTVDVLTGQDSAMCGRDYDMSKTYLVYASRNTDGALVDSICSRTRPSEDASEDFSVLGEGRSPGATPDPEHGAPTTEPPRIEPPPAGSAAGTTPRGCTIGEKPHAPLGWIALAFAGVAVATRRRGAVGSTP